MPPQQLREIQATVGMGTDLSRRSPVQPRREDSVGAETELREEARHRHRPIAWEDMNMAIRGGHEQGLVEEGRELCGKVTVVRGEALAM